MLHPLATSSTDFLLTIAAILGIGLAAQWGAWRLKVPSILLLLAFGFAAGPERLGWIDPQALLGDHLLPIVSLSVGIILFEGGLSLRVRELGAHGRVVWMLVTLGALVTGVLGAVAASLILGLDAGMATLLGAVLMVSGPTVIGPMLHHIKPHGPVSTILKWEGIVIDPIGAVAALLVFQGLELGSVSAATPLALGAIWNTLVAGTLFGLAGAGFIWVVLRRYWIPDALHVPLALTIVVLSFTGANVLQHESGLLAVTILGAVLANQKSVSIDHILEFKENLRTLLISTLFLLLSANLSNAEIALIDGRTFLFLGVLILIVRPLTVYLSTTRSTLTRKERVFLAWMCPRGIVAAAVASVFALELLKLYPNAAAAQAAGVDQLVPVTFLVIIGTVVVYGLTAPLLARRLGLSTPDPQGVLFVGAHEFACDIATALSKCGVPVMMVDTNRANVRRARLRDLPAWAGDGVTEAALEKIDLAGIGRVIAATPNDGVNRLVMLRYTHEFGRREVYRLRSRTQTEVLGAERRGRVVFGRDGADFDTLAARFRRGDTLHATRLTEQFDLAAFESEHGEDGLLLFLIDKDGRVSVNSEDQPPEPRTGDTLLALIPEKGAAPRAG